jgi:hypothetical protein
VTRRKKGGRPPTKARGGKGSGALQLLSDSADKEVRQFGQLKELIELMGGILIKLAAVVFGFMCIGVAVLLLVFSQLSHLGKEAIPAEITVPGGVVGATSLVLATIRLVNKVRRRRAQRQDLPSADESVGDKGSKRPPG